MHIITVYRYKGQIYHMYEMGSLPPIPLNGEIIFTDREPLQSGTDEEAFQRLIDRVKATAKAKGLTIPGL